MSKTAERTLNLLELVARTDEAHGLVELAAQAELDKSTASRLLAFLESRSFVARDTRTRQYRVGPAFMALAAVANRNASLTEVARPHLDRLRDESEETVSLHVRTGHERVCVAGAESPHILQRILTIGAPVAVWQGPSGKAILAFLSEEQRQPLLRRARAAGVDGERLTSQLQQTRDSGVIVTAEDRTPGVSAISAPVFDAAGVTASITIAGPIERWTTARIARVEPSLRAAAAEVSRRLGGSVP